MQLLDPTNTAEYLRDSGRIGRNERVEIRELAGGVSNMVLLVRRPDRTGENFVLKQARARLRTALPWHCRVERIWREADVLAECQRMLDVSPVRLGGRSAGTPRILFEDREQYLFAMSAATDESVVWKQHLLAGQIDAEVAQAAGHLLAALHGTSWQDARCGALLGDRSLFDELRVDPYYRTLMANCPESRPAIAPLIESMDASACCLVHADFSPKNMLISAGELLLVDFETGHFGDPAFDLGFFLSHLVLKACLKEPDHARYLALSREFERAYNSSMARAVSEHELARIWSRAAPHFAACGWARLDGKSPVEYLSSEGRRESMRTLCRRVLERRPADWSTVVALADEHFRN